MKVSIPKATRNRQNVANDDDNLKMSLNQDFHDC